MNEMRETQAMFLTMMIPVAVVFGAWAGWVQARRFHLRLERHHLRLSDWLKTDEEWAARFDAPAQQPDTARILGIIPSSRAQAQAHEAGQ